ncbi:MAG: ABC transporter permease [Ardenticatenaceae bacterium]|nr:ABC transporter permease [Ardenticatenaceae bacterium]
MSAAQLSTFITVLLSSGLVAAVPLALAALGETFAERAGLLNLGLEGMMLTAAFAGFYVALNTSSVAAGLLAGLAAGVALGVLFGFLAIGLRVDQVIIGLAITIFAAGLTGFLFRDFYGQRFPTLSVSLGTVSIPLLSSIPIIGPALFNQQVVVYLTWILVAVFDFVLTHTRFGLEVRAVGENPVAADAAGVNVFQIRYLAIAVGGLMAGFAGAFLSVADLNFFVPGMTVGQGFIAIAITMLGKWDPKRVFAGALLFGILRSLSNGLQIVGVAIRPEFVLMLPYLGIILALVILAGRTALPAALAIPYERGHR